jgi:ankyrin repeat protein
LNKAKWALDRSPEQRLLDAIDSAAEDPEKALETVKLIIETEDVDVNSLHKGFYVKRSSFLRRAAEVKENKGLEIVQFLLDHEANIDLVDDVGTALHGPVLRGNIEVVKLLLDRGVNVNLKASLIETDWTPLHLALHCGDFEILKLLLANGADPNIQDDDGKTPFDVATKKREQMDDETEQKEFDEALDELHLQTTQIKSLDKLTNGSHAR